MVNVAKLKADLKRDEGYRKSAYRDSEGYLTIGIGRLIDRKLNAGLSEHEAEYLLSNDLSKVFKELDDNLTWWREMNTLRQNALANMCFNLGITRLLGFVKMLTALKNKDYEEAAFEALNSKWAVQVGNRAKRIAKVFECGE